MHKALLTFQGEEATETAKFAGMFDKFFDCLNTSNSYVGKHLINSFKNPYRRDSNGRVTDFRLEVSNIGRLNGHGKHVLTVVGAVVLVLLRGMGEQCKELAWV